MGRVDIGTPETPCKIDLDRLIETRLFISAGSGSGKSYLIRKFVEETYGKYPIIILDLEGEFSSLREKYDFLLAGKDGDIPTDIRTADLLARKILELNTSIIIDLYELRHHERLRYVRYFIDSLIDAPKELWKPFIVIIDEIHQFIPQSGESEAAGAVIDLATRGRKRGLMLLGATQRISKADKDVVAELANNCFIGRTALDIDLKRAADILGFTTKEQVRSIRELEVGEFYVYGSAISHDVKKVRIGKVSTTHPKTGQRQVSFNRTPTETIKKVLAKLADLPKEAEEEIKDRAALLAKVKELQKQVRSQAINPEAVKEAEQRGIQMAIGTAKQEFVKFQSKVDELEGQLSKIGTIIGSKPTVASEKFSLSVFIKKVSDRLPSKPHLIQPARVITSPPPRSGVILPKNFPTFDNQEFGKCEKKILALLCSKPEDTLTKVQIGALTGYSARSGGFNNSISKLRAVGFINQRGDKFGISPNRIQDATDLAGDHFRGTGIEALEDWLNTLPKCEKEIYSRLKNEPDRIFTKEEMGEETGYSPSSGGFNNSISRLCALGLAERADGGIRFNSQLAGI